MVTSSKNTTNYYAGYTIRDFDYQIIVCDNHVESII